MYDKIHYKKKKKKECASEPDALNSKFQNPCGPTRDGLSNCARLPGLKNFPGSGIFSAQMRNSSTNQNVLATVAGSHACWRSLLEQKRRRLICISARQARTDLGTPSVPLAFSMETVTRRQELHCKTVKSYPLGWVVKNSAYVKDSF